MTRTVVRGETSMTTAEGATPNVPAEPYFGWETPFMPQRRIPILIPASNAADAIPSLRRTEHSSRGGRRAGRAARLNRRLRQADSIMEGGPVGLLDAHYHGCRPDYHSERKGSCPSMNW
jgi:hypothetical protein